MRIGLEAERANLKNPTGVERYAAELIKNLSQIDNVNEYVLYFRTKPQDWFYNLPKNFTLKVIPFIKFWTQIRLSYEIIIHPVDVLSILASALPIIHPKNSVVTVHDIAFEFFPEAFTPFMRRYLVWSTRFAVKNAKKIITVSESTKQDLIRVYKIPAEKIETIYLGLSSHLKPLPHDQVQPVIGKFKLNYKKYILFVGTLQPRKNIPRLLEAYAKLINTKKVQEKLVIVGGKGWLWEPIVKMFALPGINNQVVWLDYVSDDDLHKLYCGARLLVLPALYEGFGLPPLEAMACKTPVVVSNISSMPEVVGDAGVQVDPLSADSIAHGIFSIISDENLARNLSEKGLERAKNYTWEKTAQKTLNLYKSIAG